MQITIELPDDIANRLTHSIQGESTLRSLENLPTIAETFDEIRQICIEENFELEIPPRQDRPNPFIADDVSF